MLLWEHFKGESPLVSAHQCRPVLGYFAWRLAVARLITCMAYYSWKVDFKLDPARFTNVEWQMVPNPLATYNFGLVMGVLFLCSPAIVHGWTKENQGGE